MKKGTIVVLVIGAIALGWFVFSLGGRQSQSTTVTNNENVSIVDGQQIVTISVRGGYRPQTSTVKAGVPTILRFETNGTFDCSSSVRIPSLGISQILPSSGTTDIALGSLSAGTLQGMCGMGMYRFNLNVQG